MAARLIETKQYIFVPEGATDEQVADLRTYVRDVFNGACNRIEDAPRTAWLRTLRDGEFTITATLNDSGLE